MKIAIMQLPWWDAAASDTETIDINSRSTSIFFVRLYLNSRMKGDWICRRCEQQCGTTDLLFSLELECSFFLFV